MIRTSLDTFTKRVVDAGAITLADVRELRRTVLADGIACRDEADTLIALDRAVGDKHGTWNAFVLTAVVEFVVWTSRPTGYVDRDAAGWLVASLKAGKGPTRLAEAIAFEVVCEAEGCDERLLAFTLSAANGRLDAMDDAAALDLAA